MIAKKMMKEQWTSIQITILILISVDSLIVIFFIVYNQKMTVLSSYVGWSIGDSNPNFISCFQFYNSHFATRIICIRCNIIIIPRLYFIINDDWGDSIFSWKGQSGPSKTYIPSAGAVNMPVEGSYPFPSYKSTSPKTTSPFVAMFLTSLLSRTSKAIFFSSKTWKKISSQNTFMFLTRSVFSR